MPIALGLFALSAALIVATWNWLGAVATMPPVAFTAGEKLHCISYAPFRGEQTPWDAQGVAPWQIDEDLGRLKALTDCVRSYSVDQGLDKIPEMARKHGMTVIHGLWLSSRRDLSRIQIDTTIALVRQYPDVIRAVVVGNEVLLRGEMSAGELATIIREVKAALPGVPVTYADVWEFWLRNRDLANLVDFVTIHILPYWEDFPIPVGAAASHLGAIRRQVADAFPGKEILVGETGWPSAGRMREGALPSAINQALYLHEAVALAKRENVRINLIEAFDQPWKRRLEGTVGGHWGLFDDPRRQPKFAWGGAVSNHPHWIWQAGAGVVLAGLVFGAAFLTSRRSGRALSGRRWWGVAVVAVAGGVPIGWTAENVPLESLTIGDWLRSLAWALVSVASPVLATAALVAGHPVAPFARLLNRERGLRREPLSMALGASLLILAVLAVQATLGLVFDPRYRDFPFAPLTGAALPLLVHALLVPAYGSHRPAAETAAAVTLVLGGVYVLFNEGFANWQSIWFCAGLALLTASLLRVRGAPG